MFQKLSAGVLCACLVLPLSSVASEEDLPERLEFFSATIDCDDFLAHAGRYKQLRREARDKGHTGAKAKEWVARHQRVGYLRSVVHRRGRHFRNAMVLLSTYPGHFQHNVLPLVAWKETLASWLHSVFTRREIPHLEIRDVRKRLPDFMDLARPPHSMENWSAFIQLVGRWRALAQYRYAISERLARLPLDRTILDFESDERADKTSDEEKDFNKVMVDVRVLPRKVRNEEYDLEVRAEEQRILSQTENLPDALRIEILLHRRFLNKYALLANRTYEEFLFLLEKYLSEEPEDFGLTEVALLQQIEAGQ